MTLKGETATEHSHLGFQDVAFSLSPEIPAVARELVMCSALGISDLPWPLGHCSWLSTLLD